MTPHTVAVRDVFGWTLLLDEEDRFHVVDRNSGGVIRAKVMDLELIAKAAADMFRERVRNEAQTRKGGGA